MKKISDYLKDYDVKVDNIRYYNGNKILSTNKGEFVVKPYTDSFNYLDSRRFNNYQDSININNLYTLYKYETDSIKSNDKAIDLIYLLSMLHTKTTSYQEINLDKVKEFYEKTLGEVEYLNTYYHMFQDYVESKVYMAPFEYLFIRNASLIYKMLGFARGFLEKWYKIKSNSQRERIVRINNNLVLDNFLCLDKMKFIDWSKSRFDWNSYDFYNFYVNNYLDLEMNSLFNIYQSKYRYTEDELLLLFVLLSKLWKVSFQEDNYTNTINVFNLVRYIKKTYKFILENNEEKKKADKEKLNE